MNQKWAKYDSNFKAKAVIEDLKWREILNELAAKDKLPPVATSR